MTFPRRGLLVGLVMPMRVASIDLVVQVNRAELVDNGDAHNPVVHVSDVSGAKFSTSQKENTSNPDWQDSAGIGEALTFCDFNSESLLFEVVGYGSKNVGMAQANWKSPTGSDADEWWGTAKKNFGDVLHLGFRLERYTSTRAPACVLPASCHAAASDSTLSMLYKLEETNTDGEFEEVTGLGWYCVDVVGNIQALEYDFDAAVNNVPTPPPSVGPSISSIIIDDEGNVVEPVEPVAFQSRLVRPYNESALSCCERKSVDFTATSCPFGSSNSNRNWYVPVPGECSTALSARVYKATQGSGGFFS